MKVESSELWLVATDVTRLLGYLRPEVKPLELVPEEPKIAAKAGVYVLLLCQVRTTH